VSIAGANNYIYSATQAGDYVLLVTVFNPCIFNYYSYYTDWITITSNGQSLPTPVISAGGPTTFCQGGSVTLTSNITGNWTLNGNPVGGGPSTTYVASTTGTYQCSATNACGTGYSNPIVVNSLPLTSAITLAGSPIICSSTSHF
jgi:mannan endo-1,4-beta-mannosidase